MTMRSTLNNLERVSFGASCRVSDVRNSTAKTVCLKDDSIAKMRLKLIILLSESGKSNRGYLWWRDRKQRRSVRL
jgi:hypothetical protein